jgi:hypothetical protein
VSLPISAAMQEADAAWWRAAGGPKFDFLGFKFGSIVSPGYSHYVFDVPFWSLASVAALLPCVVAYRWLRRLRRAKLGLCVACGYDVRESHERCPECGSTIDANVR